MSQSLIIQKQAGNTLTIIRQGANTGGAYVLPAATTSVRGGVKIGNGVAITDDVLSSNATLIGLGSVNNTSDLDKPVSNATSTALAGKAALVHTHTIGEVTGLQTALDGKQASGNYVLGNDTRLSDARTPLAHTHAISDVTGLQTALDAKLSTASANATFQTIADMSSYATLASPTFTGNATAPTAANGTATTQLATTAFVANALASYVTTANFTFANLGGKPTTLAGYGITDGLTSSTAASTYAPISTTVTLTGTQTLTNKTLFGTSLTGTTSIGGTTDLSGNLLQRAGVLPITVSSASYTLQQSDCGGLIVLTGTAAQTITIPTGLSRGFNVSIFQKSAFSSTIAAGSGVTIYAKNGAKTSGQNALVGIVDVGDANPPTGFSIGGDTTT